LALKSDKAPEARAKEMSALFLPPERFFSKVFYAFDKMEEVKSWPKRRKPVGLDRGEL
jgi:hypothetical protein